MSYVSIVRWPASRLTDRFANLMRTRRLILRSAKILLLVAITSVAGFAAGFYLYRLSELGAQPQNKSIRQLTHGLRKRDSRLNLAWQALWPKLPDFITRRFPGLEPVSAASIRRDSGSELINRGAAAKDAIPGLIAALEDPEPPVRVVAIQALGKLGPLAGVALDDLIRFFGNDANDNPRGAISESPRGHAALGLDGIAPDEPRVVRLLCDALREKRPAGMPSQVSLYALRGLERVAAVTNSVVPVLITTLKSISVDPVKLGQAHDTNAALPIVSALQVADANANFAVQILGIIGRVRPPGKEAMSAVIESFWNRDGRIRSAAVLASANMGTAASEAVPLLIALYRDTLHENISNTKPAAPMPPPNQFTQWTPSRTNAAASYSGPTPVERFGLLRAGPPNSNLPEQILWAIGRIGTSARAALPFLIQEYENKTNRYRVDAALACWRMEQQTSNVLAILAEELANDAPLIRRKVVRALRAIGGPALPIAMAALKDDDDQVRYAAIEALQSLGPAALEAVPALETILQGDSRNALRMAAANALKKI